MQKKLIALAVAGLSSSTFAIEPQVIRGYAIDTAGHAVLRKERGVTKRITGTAAAKRAAKKRRNKK
jgi:hypothetical protein